MTQLLFCEFFIDYFFLSEYASEATTHAVRFLGDPLV